MRHGELSVAGDLMPQPNGDRDGVARRRSERHDVSVGTGRRNKHNVLVLRVRSRGIDGVQSRWRGEQLDVLAEFSWAIQARGGCGSQGEWGCRRSQNLGNRCCRLVVVAQFGGQDLVP